MQESVDTRHSLDMDLHGALEEGQFFLLYQPFVHLTSGAVTGVEALLRWRHPTRGVLPPSEFIPALESSGLIVSVGQWVLETACRQAAQWQREGHRAAGRGERGGPNSCSVTVSWTMSSTPSVPADSIPLC